MVRFLDKLAQCRLWQALRLCKYEQAVTHKQMEDVAKDESLFGHGDAMLRLLSRGVESVKAEFGVMERALGLIGSIAFASDDEPLEKDDCLLLLQMAAELALNGKTVEQCFTGLPAGSWTWRVVRQNLQELAEASRKSLPGILKSLHSHILEQLDSSRKTLEEGLRAIQANYALKNGETERLLLYHSRVQHRISKWLSMLAQSKADRLGLTITHPLETNGGNGDGPFE
jgi:hypothetical protein